MNDVIYNGQRVKIQLDSRDDSNANTGVDLSTATTLQIRVKTGSTVVNNTATIVPADNYSCYINYSVPASTEKVRRAAWIYAEISGTEKYYGVPFEFDTLPEGE